MDLRASEGSGFEHMEHLDMSSLEEDTGIVGTGHSVGCSKADARRSRVFPD